MSNYNRIPCETICRSDWWTHISHAPRFTPGPYWGFFPEVGNDEEGWGFVEIVYCDRGTWVRWRGEPLEPQPLMWAEVNKPMAPFKVVEDETNARDLALAQIIRQNAT